MYRLSGVCRVKSLTVFRAVFGGLYRCRIINDMKPFTPTGRRRTGGGTGSNGHKITQLTSFTVRRNTSVLCYVSYCRSVKYQRKKIAVYFVTKRKYENATSIHRTVRKNSKRSSPGRLKISANSITLDFFFFCLRYLYLRNTNTVFKTIKQMYY